MEQNIDFPGNGWFSNEVSAILNQTIIIMPNWKWALLAILFTAGILLKPVFSWILKFVKLHNPFIKRYPAGFTAQIMKQPIEQPLAWLLILLSWMVGIDGMDVPGKMNSYLTHTVQAFITLQLIILMYYAVNALKEVTLFIVKKNGDTNNYSAQIIPYAAQAAKILIVVLGVLITLQSFGLNVMSLLAGLGLGGLALALAAQDTAANVFGSLTIMFDHPFRVGDLIKIKDMEGTVEAIGLRSTRIRTSYNSVIAIPNALVAKENVDNMGVRPARRIRQVLGLTYETSPERISEFCNIIREMIRTDQNVIADTVTVNFNNYGASSLDVLVNFHLRVYTWSEELSNQERIFLNILRKAAEMNIDFAYPTSTTYQHSIESVPVLESK